MYQVIDIDIVCNPLNHKHRYIPLKIAAKHHYTLHVCCENYDIYQELSLINVFNYWEAPVTLAALPTLSVLRP